MFNKDPLATLLGSHRRRGALFFRSCSKLRGGFEVGLGSELIDIETERSQAPLWGLSHPGDLGLAQLPGCFTQPVRQLVVVIEDPVQDLPGPDSEVIDVSLSFSAVPALRVPPGRKVPVYYVSKNHPGR